MAFRLQRADQHSTYIQPDAKKVKMDTHTPPQSSSPKSRQTEKRCYNCDPAGNQNLYHKSTQRNLGNSIILNSICLTERSSLDNREEKWSINFQQKENTPKEGLTQIYNMLQDNGLLQVFYSFETLRDFIIDHLSIQKPSKAHQLKNKLSLFQFIADFKAKLLHIQSPQKLNQDETDKQSLKELLKQVSFLRAENYRLKEKMHQYRSEIGHSPKLHINNSLIENSLTFNDNSSAMSNSKNTNESNSSIDLKLKKLQNQLIQPFYLIKQENQKFTFSSLEDKATLESYQNSFKPDEQSISSQTVQQQKCSIYTLNILPEIYSHDTKQSKFELKAEWQRSLAKSIIVCKKLFKNYIFSSNVALFKTQRLKELTNIVKAYNNYRPKLVEKSESEFLRESNQLTELMSSLSQQILALIKSEFLIVAKPSEKQKC